MRTIEVDICSNGGKIRSARYPFPLCYLDDLPDVGSITVRAVICSRPCQNRLDSYNARGENSANDFADHYPLLWLQRGSGGFR